MFDLNSVNKRYFGVTLHLEDSREVQINVEPPKLKTLKKLTTLSKSNPENVVSDLEEALAEVLNKNREKINIEEYVEEMTIDEMQQLLTAFFTWLNKEKQAKN